MNFVQKGLERRRERDNEEAQSFLEELEANDEYIDDKNDYNDDKPILQSKSKNKEKRPNKRWPVTVTSPRRNFWPRDWNLATEVP